MYLITLVMTIVDYFVLTCGDPVDRLVEGGDGDGEQVEDWKGREIRYDRRVGELRSDYRQ